MTNTLKYAQARNFRARLNCNAWGVRLELRDDGRGFEVRDRYDGLGLTGMRERVEQMHGELEITSAPGKGTKIVIALLPDRGQDNDIEKEGHSEGWQKQEHGATI